MQTFIIALIVTAFTWCFLVFLFCLSIWPAKTFLVLVCLYAWWVFHKGFKEMSKPMFNHK